MERRTENGQKVSQGGRTQGGLKGKNDGCMEGREGGWKAHIGSMQGKKRRENEGRKEENYH